MTRPTNSKNPVHNPNHPHHLPDVADAVDPTTKKVKPEVFVPNVKKAMKLWEEGAIEFSEFSETAVDGDTDRISFNRKHTGK
jgi:hypothetical protein